MENKRELAFSSEVKYFEKEHFELVKKYAPECTVLLKSDSTLPFVGEERLALFGSGARHHIKGGTGSGDVHVRSVKTVEEALEDLGFAVVTKQWMDDYDGLIKDAEESFHNKLLAEAKSLGVDAQFYMMGKEMPQPEYNLSLEGEADTAIYVLSRNSGEGADRTIVPGDINLTETEIKDIKAANDKYKKFLLVLNVGGMVNLAPVKDVKNILLLGQLGMATAETLGAIIKGDAYPSGKLTMTWADIDEYPSTEGFGNPDDTIYHEGIYVGYRHFKSKNKKPLFCFGHGLGFTEFELNLCGVSVNKEEKAILVETKVKNIGNLPGKEVVQVYVSKPEQRLEQPKIELVGFAKTDELGPKQEQKLSVRIPDWYLKSYDESLDKYIVEPGQYKLCVGTSSENLLGEVSFTISETDAASLTEECNALYGVTTGKRNAEIENLTDSLSDETLARICVGAGADKEGGVAEIIGNASTRVKGAAGETAAWGLGEKYKTLVMSDGPAGIRINEYTTAIPIGTGIAQSFNEKLCYDLGVMIGEEMEYFDIQLWLAPAMNIQRSPLCGRNFEYYSEDPVVSGKIAAAITRGVQLHENCGTVIKHFACNNQETNRYSSNSIVSKRALFDIYLKGFEICVKESNPKAIMSSYNLLNGEHTCNSRFLLTEVLREQWGYEGIVMTDWFATGSFMNQAAIECGVGGKHVAGNAAGCVFAGNDLIMPGASWDVAGIMAALNNESAKYPLTRDNLKECAARILRLAKGE